MELGDIAFNITADLLMDCIVVVTVTQAAGYCVGVHLRNDRIKTEREMT